MFRPRRVQGESSFKTPALQVAFTEVTQGLQYWSEAPRNEAPLVRGKPTVIRAYPRATAGAIVAGVTASLRVGIGDEPLVDVGIDPDNGPIDAIGETWRRDDPNSSLNFTLEPAWYDADLTHFQVVLHGDGVDAAGELMCCHFHEMPGLDIEFLQIHYTNPRWRRRRWPSRRTCSQQACNLLRSLYPLDPTRVTYEPHPVGEIDFADHRHGSDHPNCGMLRIRLSSLARGAESNRQLFAWLPADACVTGGLDGLANRSALGNDDGRRRDASWRWLFAHEIAHNFVGSNYHVTRPLEANEVGFDVLHVDPWRREAIAADSADLPLYDLMRGRARAPRASDRQRWIGRQTFEKLFYALSRRPPLAGGAPGAGHMSGKSGDPALLEQFTRTPAMGADGMTVLSWSGAADRFDLHYSHDDQATWRHLAFSSRTRLTIDEGLLAGGERCFYRLTAWSVDGIICESRQVGPFRVRTRPRARIIVPDGSSAYRAGGSAVLLAYGIAIPADADFHWRLNGELVGIGQKAVARRLQAGVHRLELTVAFHRSDRCGAVACLHEEVMLTVC